MPNPNNSSDSAEARGGYFDPSFVASYESDRYSSMLGRYTWRREQRAVGAMIAKVVKATSVLDCPCGMGRWLPAIEGLRPDRIVEADISPAMLAASRERSGGKHTYAEVDAEHLPFADGEFELVFSHALTKHLSVEAQRQVLAEFARVSSKHVICSFSVNEGIPALARKLRRGQLSRGVRQAWLEDAARAASLRIVDSRKCTTPIGLERTVLFEKL